MAAKKGSPASVREVAERLGVEKFCDPVADEDIEKYRKVTNIEERKKTLRSMIKVWKDQQNQDRKMRERYATWLMIAMACQVVAINLVFALIGFGAMKFEPWTANTFIMATFAEIGALVLLVVKYLFPAPKDRFLDLIDRFKDRSPDE